MSFIMFIFASTLEFISIFTFAMVLFRFPLRDHLSKFVLSSIILSFVSNTLQSESLQDISPLIIVFLIFFLVSIILRVKLLHSLIMVAISYVTFSFVQWVLFTLLIHFKVFTAIEPYTWPGYSLQIITFLSMSLISWTVIARKGGFGYIQSNSRFYKETFRGNKWFVIFLITGLVLLFAVNVMFLTSYHIDSYLYTIAIIILSILIILIYFSIRKDGSGD